MATRWRRAGSPRSAIRRHPPILIAILAPTRCRSALGANSLSAVHTRNPAAGSSRDPGLSSHVSECRGICAGLRAADRVACARAHPVGRRRGERADRHCWQRQRGAPLAPRAQERGPLIRAGPLSAQQARQRRALLPRGRHPRLRRRRLDGDPLEGEGGAARLWRRVGLELGRDGVGPDLRAPRPLVRSLRSGVVALRHLALLGRRRRQHHHLGH